MILCFSYDFVVIFYLFSLLYNVPLFEYATICLTKCYLYGFQFLADTSSGAMNILYMCSDACTGTFWKGGDSQVTLPLPAALVAPENLLERKILGLYSNLLNQIL